MRNKSARFLDALLLEIEKQSAAFAIQPETIYFGGGTPTSLSLSQIDFLLNGLRARLDLSRLTEFTFEMNPATVSPDKARLLHTLGVDRASIGVQSWNDETLQKLGRSHTAEHSQRTFHTLREAGFANINFDLMFAVPGQTAAQLQRDLEKLIEFSPEHISAYCLTYEEDTAYFQKLQSREFHRDDELGADFFEMTMDALESAGYAHYEISNYAKPAYESAHNFAYWNGADYLGIGPGAFSTVADHRWENVRDSVAYSDALFDGRSPRAFEESLSPATQLSERMAFGLRTNRGLARAALEPWSEQIRGFRELGFLEDSGERVVLTRKGRLMADAIAEVFV